MTDPRDTIKVWDPLVRIGHWTLVIAFFTAYFTAEEWLTAHVWAGYVVGAVVLLRVAWGLIGSRHARFSDFVRSPRAVLAYLRDLLARRPAHYLGHNPAGGAMIIALLIGLAGTVGSGLVLYAIEEDAGPLAGWVANDGHDAQPPMQFPTALRAAHASVPHEGNAGGTDDHYDGEDEREEFWEEIHEVFTNIMLVLIALHVAGVLLSSYIDRENLVAAMFSGRKRRPAD